MKEYTQKVENCLNEINKDIDSMNFKNKTNEFKDKMIAIVLADVCKKNNLKLSIIKRIYLSK